MVGRIDRRGLRCFVARCLSERIMAALLRSPVLRAGLLLSPRINDRILPGRLLVGIRGTSRLCSWDHDAVTGQYGVGLSDMGVYTSVTRCAQSLMKPQEPPTMTIQITNPMSSVCQPGEEHTNSAPGFISASSIASRSSVNVTTLQDSRRTPQKVFFARWLPPRGDNGSQGSMRLDVIDVYTYSALT